MGTINLKNVDDRLYVLEYCDCIHESSYETVSLHRTLEGVDKAKDKLIRKLVKEQKRSHEYRRREDPDYVIPVVVTMGSMEDVRIRRVKVKD